MEGGKLRGPFGPLQMRMLLDSGKITAHTEASHSEDLTDLVAKSSVEFLWRLYPDMNKAFLTFPEVTQSKELLYAIEELSDEGTMSPVVERRWRNFLEDDRVLLKKDL